MTNLFRKAIQNLDAHWRRPAYPLDFKLIREALVSGEELLQLAPSSSPGELLALYTHLSDVFFPLSKTSNRKAVRTASAILLHTMYLGKGSFIQKYQLIDILRTNLPGTDAARDIDETNNLTVRLHSLRSHLTESGWSRKDVRTSHNYGNALSPRLQEAVARAVDQFKASQRPPLNLEQREDAEQTVRNALLSEDEDEAKHVCKALAAKGYLTYG